MVSFKQMLHSPDLCFWIVALVPLIQGYILHETECPHEIDPGISDPDYWVPPGVAYRAWRTLPWRMFSIQASSIPGAGLGVFTTRFLPKYTWIGIYEGEILNNEQTEEAESFEYTWRVYTDDEVTHFVDGGDPTTSNWLRFINCPCHSSQENVVMHTCYGLVYYKTKKDLAPGQELLVYYGDNYAEDNLGIDIMKYKLKQYAPKKS